MPAFRPERRHGAGLPRPDCPGWLSIRTSAFGFLSDFGLRVSGLEWPGPTLEQPCGTGEVQIGEGVMSLRRAFRLADAQTVLASHWPVNDRATRQLMTEFIRRWRSGEPRAKAWREAQLSLLRSKEFSSPYCWAAFTLTGQWN